MSEALEIGVLKGVSRSFYLTLRLLPAPMRRAASLGYLLARSSDTIADTAEVPATERLELLAAYGVAVDGMGELPRWSRALLDAAESKERVLLERGREVLDGLAGLPAGERDLVREVVRIIVSGQQLDLERFALASPERPVALENDAALEDYTWRVAGCVGAFWTKLGFLTLGTRFSSAPENELLERGIAYGKGLQLVNILRDLPRDLAMGRCYLPVANPADREALLACHARWLTTALDWVEGGKIYAETLKMKRLRAATVLPAWLAEETLRAMQSASWEDLRQRVKVPRSRVYALLLKALLR
jgi:farnesyl-diphosphate farnesyltransferase